MTVAPRGLSIQSAYRQYREGKLIVNRKYQRKLVWAIEEKIRLIDSILRGYPIPLILLAEHRKNERDIVYEIIDGIQRLNAIFAFVENQFAIDGKYFDVNQSTRAQQLAKEGSFLIVSEELLAPEVCANFLDYELAVTIYPAKSEDEVTDIFGRINSNGRQLSNQEKRQAGVINSFAEMVRGLASELRGDVSKDILLLYEMPSISIETPRDRQGYGVFGEETDWCYQGILNIRQLRESEDEQMIADIAASILLEEPFSSSRENLDELYIEESEYYKKIQTKLTKFNVEEIKHGIKTTFSVLIDIVKQSSNERNALKRIVRKDTSSNPIKTEFYAIFMALYRLLVQEEKSPSDALAICKKLNNLQSKLTSARHHVTVEDRKNNINIVYGLISDFFFEKEPPIIRHGPGLKIDFVNAIRRSRTETPRYEFKQGILNLSPKNRNLNEDLLNRILETICGIANIGPDSTGYLFIGVADTKDDAHQIELLDKIVPKNIENRYIVGVDRECVLLNLDIEEYMEKILNVIRNSNLSENLRIQILSKIDIPSYEGLSVIRLTIPSQKQVSYLNGDIFIRDGTSTIKANHQQAVAISQLFKK